MSGAIIFNMINANGMETNAAVFVGENAANGWDSHNKNQLEIGMNFTAFGAYNAFTNNINLLSDNDLIDTLISDSDFESSLNNQI